MLTIFQFESQEIRFVGTADDPWWVAADVCAALGLDNNSRAVSRLDDDEKGITISNTLGGNQEMITISESGLYSLILTSRKPQAKRFKKWLTSEVIPSIRKTGKYALPSQSQPQEDIELEIKVLQQCLAIANLRPELIAGIVLNHSARRMPQLTESTNEAHKILAATTESELLLTPTSIGERLGISARAVNKLLLGMGLQTKNPRKGKGEPSYLATAKGKKYAGNTIATGKVGDNTSYQHLKWQETIVEVLSQVLSGDQGND